MSAALTLVEPATHPVAADQFKAYLQANLTSDLVMQIMEECLLQENSTYNTIDFEQALKDLQQRDGSRYLMLKTLMEGYATKEGMVMLDPKLVTASFKQRMKQLEALKAMNWFGRFCFRFALAVKVMIGQTTKTQALQEAIDAVGEVQIARDELAVLELKKSQTARDVDEMLTEASHQKRIIIEAANERATKTVEKVYKESREAIAAERKDFEIVKEGIPALKERMAEAWESLTHLNDERYKQQAQMQISSSRIIGNGEAGTSAANGTYTPTAGFAGYSGFSGISGYKGFSGYSTPAVSVLSEVSEWRKGDEFEYVRWDDQSGSPHFISVGRDGFAFCWSDSLHEDKVKIPIEILVGHNKSLRTRRVEQELEDNDIEVYGNNS